MSFICEYCIKTFSTKGNLKNHQDNAKFCLDIRKKLYELKEKIVIEDDKNEKGEKTDKFSCNYCSKILSCKYRLQQHLEHCKVKYYEVVDQKNEELKTEFMQKISTLKNFYERELKTKEHQIIRLEEQNKKLEEHTNKLHEQNLKLQEQIKDLATIAIERPTQNTLTYNQNNNTMNSQHNIKNIDNRTVNMIPFNLTSEGIKEALESKFSEAHLMKGQKGVAEFMLENVLILGENDDKKYLMKCTDASRKTFITLDSEGKISKDVNAENLTKMISGPVKEVSHKLFQDIQDRFFNMYESISSELEDGDKEKDDLAIENERLDYATNKVCEISRLKNNNSEFVKSLISPLSI